MKAYLGSMCDYDSRAPSWTPVDLRTGKEPDNIKVAVIRDPGNGGVDKNILCAIDRASDILNQKGFLVEEKEPPGILDAWRTWFNITSAELQTVTIPQLRDILSEEGLAFLHFWQTFGDEASLTSFIHAFGERHRILRQWMAFQEEYPIILGPISTKDPFPAGYDITGEQEFEEVIYSIRLQTCVNLLGLPATTVPVELIGGHPQCIQIIAPRFREDLSIDIAKILEKECGIFTPIYPKEE